MLFRVGKALEKSAVVVKKFNKIMISGQNHCYHSTDNNLEVGGQPAH